jgi:hypothetical protein
MSELIAILDIEDKRLLSLYENDNFDKIIRSTTIKIKLAEKPKLFCLKSPSL